MYVITNHQHYRQTAWWT